MIIAKVVLSQILVTANGKNKFALGLDASQFDQRISRDKQLPSTLDNSVGNTRKPKSLRGLDGVNTNVLAGIGSNRADLTVPAKKNERSSRLVGVPTGVS